jgi:hypothetical protein
VKSRWGDGSLKHAVISFLIPTLSPNQSVTVSLSPGTTVGNVESSYYIPDAYMMPILAAFRILVERARKCAWERERDAFELS